MPDNKNINDEELEADKTETVEEPAEGSVEEPVEDTAAEEAPGEAEAADTGNEEEPDENKGKRFWQKQNKPPKKDKKDEMIDELKDKLTRQMAEFENFRKRTEKEKAQNYAIGAKEVIEKLLPIVDNFERGLVNADLSDPFADGMDKIYKQMTQAMEAMGVTVIEAEGKEFDPNFHNAVMHIEDENLGENVVAQVLQKGYMYKDTVLRYAMVSVAN